MSTHGAAIPLHLRSAVALTFASLIGLAAFCWPLLMTPEAGIEHGGDAPWLFAVMLPLLIAVVAAELADGGMDAKAVAMLGVLAAVGAALRPLGGGATGFQPMFVVIVIGGYVFGAGFGFTLGATSAPIEACAPRTRLIAASMTSPSTDEAVGPPPAPRP